jgi:hypothetical protein
MTCPKDDVLVLLSDGELAESQARTVRAHVEQCTRCRAELAELTTIAGDLRADVPGALGGKSVEAFADDIVAQLDRPRAEPLRPSRWSRWSLMLAACVALPLAALAVIRSTRPPVDDFTARGATSTSSSASSTNRTLLRFGRVVDKSFEPIAEGAQLDADAVLAAEVGNTEGAPRFLLAFMIDALGERHWIYPAYDPGIAPPSSVAVPMTSAPRVLGSMVRLDHPAPGPARLVAIVLPRSESVEHVERAPLDELSRERLAARYEGSLVIVTRVEIRK